MRPPVTTRVERSRGERAGPSRRLGGRHREALSAVLAAVVVLLLCFTTATPSAAAEPAASAADSGAHALAAPAVAGSYCYSINSSICVSMVNSTESDIIPSPGGHSTSVTPNPSDNLALYVESKYDLVWPTAHGTGPLSPIALNVTAILWNGVPYYSMNDSSVWHPSGSTWWGYGPTGQNTTYPYWYTINFTARAASGIPNFYPGMAITWWVYIVSNTSGVVRHLENLTYFHFTYGGAWPVSPYSAYPDHAGAAAALEDVSVAQQPLVPNFNDTVKIFLSTTPRDLETGALIGAAYVDVTETAPDGALLNQGTWAFPINSSKIGTPESNITLPASYSQVAGALVQYRVTASDTNPYGPDTVQTPSFNYTVNGNGTFKAHSFVNDLVLTGTPQVPQFAGRAPPEIPEGQPVHLLLASASAGTAILAAEVDYSLNYGALGENSSYVLPMTRLNSTHFDGTIPAMPLNVTVTYTVVAWDFAQDKDLSPMYEYTTPGIATTLLTVPSNSTFFLTYVYDIGTSTWVSGATVQVRGVSGYIHTWSQTLGGVAYPNASGRAFVPLFLPAGATYHIYVNDSTFLPAGATAAPSVEITVTMAHDMTTNGVLAVGAYYEVAESGNAFYFWLNQTAAGPTYSSPPGGIGSSTSLLAAVGLGAFALVCIPTLLWWREIRRQRESEERRIVL